VLVHDVHLVAVDEGSEQHAFGEVLFVTENLESVDSSQLEGRFLMDVLLKNRSIFRKEFLLSLNLK
jgi:hypothetical protein